MIEVAYQRGVHLPGLNLALDPGLSAGRAFVSHAHSDHTGRHEVTIATPVTLRLMQARMGKLPGEQIPVPFFEKRDFGEFQLELLPAGHVLGSAQSLIEAEAGSLLYTGDFKLRSGLSSEPAAFRHAEVLVMETTYGLPRYVFPPAAEVIAKIVRFCLEAVEDEEVPVLLGYSLGKAQEVLASLCGAGMSVMLHSSIEALMDIYRAEGISFPETIPWNPREASGHVVICPPTLAGSKALASIAHRKVAAVTGWAMEPGAIHRMRCDAAFPLSDHAGFDDLLQHVENVNPKRVLTLHGFAREFAAELRARGWEAWSLTSPDQLEFFPVAAKVKPQSREAPASEAGEGFLKFATVCDEISQVSGKRAKIRILAAYLKALSAEDLRNAAVWLTGRAFAAADDQAHGAGWAVVKRALRAASGMEEVEFRALSRRWNDAGMTAGEVMLSRGGNHNPSLPEAARLFHGIRSARGPLEKGALIESWFRSVPATASRYSVKILSGDLRIGLKEGLLEDALAEAFSVEAAWVREANMMLGDLGEVAVRAKLGNTEPVAMKLFRPVKCMLAAPEPDAESVWKRLEGSLWLEEKFDGIRAQLHAGSGRAEIYSRDLHVISRTFPELIREAAEFGKDVVLDGEIVGWSGGRPLSFFELQKRLGRGGDLFLGGEIPVLFLAFDLLSFGGETLLRLPLRERRERLEALSMPPHFRAAAARRVDSASEIDRAFAESREAGHEGLIAKDPESSYTPGRRGGAWIKLKKQFATLDVVVTAVEYGHGRRRDVLSDYTFAVRDERRNELVTIGKAYTGLTDAEIAEMTSHFLSTARTQTGNRIEVEPEIVLEVAFDSLRASSRHPSGMAMRFPRIVRIRKDKTPADIDTVESARRLVV